MIPGVKLWALALALGYVLPSYGILKRMAENRDEQALTGIKVEGAAVVSPGGAREVANLLGVEWTSGELALNFTAMIRFPGRCRLELSSGQSTKVLAAVSSNGKRRSEGGELPALTSAVDQLCAVLALRGGGDGESRAAVERHLGTLKVNRAVTSLARFRGTVTYVVGDPGADAPQLWIYKDHFAPARLRYTDEKQNKWDVQFFDYSSAASGEAFPRLLLIQKGADPVLRLTSLKSDLKARLDDAVF